MSDDVKKETGVSLTKDTIEFDGVSYPVGLVFDAVEKWIGCAKEAGWQPPLPGGESPAPLVTKPPPLVM